MKKMLVLLLLFVVGQCAIAQKSKLQPGFDKEEYIEMLKIAQKQHIDVDKWQTVTTVPDPQKYKQVYRSQVMAFENMWDLWLSADSMAVISVRGSVVSSVSFLANFYAAMTPATGQLELEKNFKFNYHLSDKPQAAVHVGFLIAMAYLSRDILPKVDSCYKKLGIRDFTITGHSQGGAICYLLTSYLESLRSKGELPQEIRFKTYCGAAPKPGNLFYAYSYEKLTSGGWAYNIVNTADWVPEVPFSVQTTDDFTEINPFVGAKKMIKEQKFPMNLALRHAYEQMSKPSMKARRNYQKYLGKMVSKMVQKQLPELKIPSYSNSNYYVRTGNTIVLYADEEYNRLFPPNPEQIWANHLIQPYLFLVQKLK